MNNHSKFCYDYTSTGGTLRARNTSGRDREFDACAPGELHVGTHHALGDQRRFTITLTADNGIVHLAASRSVDEVLKHLLSILQTKGITVFAVVDHSGEAAKIGFEMRPTKLVIFGNPKAGTPLMIAAPDSALDLPLKILIAEEPSGSTRVSYNSLGYLRARYELTPEIVKNVAAIEQIAATAVG